MAACWFNYLFYFLERVVKTPAAASAILAGQIADGLATPFAGFLSDRTKTVYGTDCMSSGQRTPWYIGGLLLAVAGYIPIFHKFNSSEKTYEYLYYCAFPAIFNIGWAFVQISHMSLVPSLTCSRKRRVHCHICSGQTQQPP
jgi:Na+/melibiose symporter-like transporter